MESTNHSCSKEHSNWSEYQIRFAPIPTKLIIKLASDFCGIHLEKGNQNLKEIPKKVAPENALIYFPT